MAQYQAGDFFDIQMKCRDIANHTRLLAPSFALNFGAPPAWAQTEVEVNDLVILTGEQLKPLFWLIGGFF